MDSNRINVEKVGIQAEEFLNEHWAIVYDKHFIFSGEILCENEKNICGYFDSLLDLRKALLATMSMPNSLKCYDEVNYELTKLRNDPIFQNYEPSSSFCLTIDAISNQVTHKINELRNQNFSKIFLASFVLYTSYLLHSKNPEQPIVYPFIEGFIVTASATLLTKYIEQPIKNALSHFKFFNKEKINNERPIIEVPEGFLKMD